MAPSTTFINSRLVGTPDPAETYTVVVDGGGTISSIEKTAKAAEPSKESNIYDLRGELYIAPSLVDFHTHFTSFTLSTRRLDLYECRSLAEVVAQVKPYVEEASQRDVPFITAFKMRVAEWPEEDKMTREELDNITTTRPLVILFAGLHSLCANSMALRLLGHDPEGHDGILLEGDCFKTFSQLNDIPDEVLDQWVDQTASDAA